MTKAFFSSYFYWLKSFARHSASIALVIFFRWQIYKYVVLSFVRIKKKKRSCFVLYTLFEASEISISLKQRLNIAYLVSWGRLPQTSPVWIVKSCQERWTGTDNLTLCGLFPPNSPLDEEETIFMRLTPIPFGSITVSNVTSLTLVAVLP